MHLHQHIHHPALTRRHRQQTLNSRLSLRQVCCFEPIIKRRGWAQVVVWAENILLGSRCPPLSLRADCNATSTLLIASSVKEHVGQQTSACTSQSWPTMMQRYMAPVALVDYMVPRPSTLRDPKLALYFAISILILHSLFHALAFTVFRGADPKKLKQRCWILTTVNAFVMTAVSLPYLWDLLSSGFDLHAVRHRDEWLTKPASCFFIAYLLSDLGLGSIYYRHLINLSSGWIHHFAYTFLFAYWMHKQWAYIAVMACVFELPTFVMGIASLHPPFRSNILFTSTFFVTRIFFHFGLLLATWSTHGRSTPGIEGSWGVPISVLVTYPMHLWWGYKCILSTRRRMHKRRVDRRKEREALLASMKEGGLGAYFGAAGQMLNGMPDPQVSSALNTPATTPGSSPVLSAADKRPSSPFQRAAAVAGGPIKLVMGRRRKDSDVSEKSFSLSDSATAANGSGAGPSSNRQPFTKPVRPEGALPQDREPFLAIRSPAETRDRARRLVADAIRKAWASAPESWRKQFEADIMAAFDSATPATLSRRASEDTSGEEMDAEMIAEAEAQVAADVAAAEAADDRRDERTRAQRGKDAARRALVRAIRRAINGKETREQAAAEAAAAAASEVVAEAKAQAEVSEDQRNERRLLQSILRLGGIELPPDMVGQEYIVREFPVEQDTSSSRHTRLLGQLRRRMEVANREVVVFD